MYENQLNDICNGVHFFDKIAGWGSATLPKICSSTSIFQGFCSDFYKDFLKIFTNFCFPENLLVALADSGLRKPKTLNVSSCNLIIPKWQNIHVISNRKCTTKIPLKYITKPVESVYFICVRCIFRTLSNV